MLYILRLTKAHEADLIAASEVLKLQPIIREGLRAAAEGRSIPALAWTNPGPTCFCSLHEDAMPKKKTIGVRINDQKDAEVVQFIHSLRPRCINNFIIGILRQSLGTSLLMIFAGNPEQASVIAASASDRAAGTAKQISHTQDNASSRSVSDHAPLSAKPASIDQNIEPAGNENAAADDDILSMFESIL